MLLSLALMLMIGFMLSEVAGKLYLPKIIGMLISGILLGPYVFDLIAPEMLDISLDLRQIALIVILLRAGLSLDFKDLKSVGKNAVLLSFLPSMFEFFAALVFGPLFLGLTLMQSALLGSILAAVSPAVVVPKMLALMKGNLGTKKKIPQMIMASASVEDVFVIVLFTSLVTMADEGSVHALSFMALPVAILLGIASGVVLGLVFVWFFKHIHMRDTAKVLIMLSFSMLLLVLEHAGFFPFSGLLATMSLGITILATYPRLADRLVKKYEKIWVFTEMLLFVLIGAAVDITTIPDVGPGAIAMIAVLLMIRAVGVYIATTGNDLCMKERMFVVFAYLPKATVQASIASIPLAMGIEGGNTMLTVAVLAILITAPLGSFLIDLTKHPLLEENT